MLSRPEQSESSTPEVAGVVHIDGTVCRTASSRRSESRGASAWSAAIASAAVDWMVSARFGPWPTRAARTRPGFGSRSRILSWPIAVTCEFLARSERICTLNQGLELACAPGPCGRRRRAPAFEGSKAGTKTMPPVTEAFMTARERAMCLVPQKPRTRVRRTRTGTENLSANFTAGCRRRPSRPRPGSAAGYRHARRSSARSSSRR